MDCCGGGLTRRQWMWSTLLASAGALITGAGTRGNGVTAAPVDASSAAAQAILKDYVSIDVHSHTGTTGITSRSAPSDDLARNMRSGGMATVCLAGVPDGPLLGRKPNGVLATLRDPAPGELYRYHLDRLTWMDEMIAKHGARRALTVADLNAAHAARQPAIIEDIEELDFLERKLERLEESYQRGVRHMHLVHYTPNDIGDFQTGAVTHNGLTPFGADVIRACNRLGIGCDVAHATEDTVKQAVKCRASRCCCRTRRCKDRRPKDRRRSGRARSAATTRAPSRRPGAPSASGISSQASSVTSTA
jgi:membrane dipeptidase